MLFLLLNKSACDSRLDKMALLMALCMLIKNTRNNIFLVEDLI